MPRHPSVPASSVVLVTALLTAAPVAVEAQSANADGTQTYTLTQQQKDQLMATGSESAVDASLLRARNGGDGKIHGEIGMTVGTRNTRGIYGDAVVPLGHGATAAISFDHYQTDPGKVRWRHGGFYWPEPDAPY